MRTLCEFPWVCLFRVNAAVLVAKNNPIRVAPRVLRNNDFVAQLPIGWSTRLVLIGRPRGEASIRSGHPTDGPGAVPAAAG